MKIEFDKDALQKRQIDKKDGKYRHQTKDVKILPFVSGTGADAYKGELRTFSGIIGDLFRRAAGYQFAGDLAEKMSQENGLKEFLLQRVLDGVETAQPESLKRVIGEVAFRGNQIHHFDRKTYNYQTYFRKSSPLERTAKFILDLFFGTPQKQKGLVSGGDKISNLLYKTLSESLGGLNEDSANYHPEFHPIGFENVQPLFARDFEQIAKDDDLFHDHFARLLKFYYFRYLSRVVFHLNSFFEEPSDRPLYYSLSWESISRTRRTVDEGWKYLSSKITSLFAHVNTLQLLHYLKIDGQPCGSYLDFIGLEQKASESEQTQLLEYLKEIQNLYMDAVPPPRGGWEGIEDRFTEKIRLKSELSDIQKEVYRLYFLVDHQFFYSTRKAAAERYKSWFEKFCMANYVKRRGRVGYTLVLDHEMILLLTRLSIGTKSKIRLRTLWEEFTKRGVAFDDLSKKEIVRLFERINLIEKKSDSGDAQYVKRIL